jgi:hypothetical protein
MVIPIETWALKAGLQVSNIAARNAVLMKVFMFFSSNRWIKHSAGTGIAAPQKAPRVVEC